jgi:chemotaxis protein methyltransferase CheR
VHVSDSSSRILAALLEARTGQQLTMSRRWRIETALSSLLRDRGIATLDELITILVMEKEPGLADQVVDALLNNETYFFRDRSPFDTILHHALPVLASLRASTRRLRIWSAGCSTGQEAYSIAMMFAEDPVAWRDWTIDIVGTDVSATAVAQARAGAYSQFEVQRGLAITQMVRWFEEHDGGWRAIEPLRRRVRFQVHNMLDAPPQRGGFDIILCRNVLLYLNAEKRTLAFDRLASALAPDGWLMLGAGETVIGQTSKLSADQQVRGLYRHSDGEKYVTDRRSAIKA